VPPEKQHHSKWTGPLARAIGWHPNRLKYFLKKRDYPPPYNDQGKALRMLEDAGVSIGKYKPEQAKTSPAATIATKKKHGAKRSNLIKRLAQLLPKPNKEWTRQKVRLMLRAGGLKANSKDEAKALEILKANGISIEGFEYENAPEPEKNAAPSSAPSVSIAEVTGDYETRYTALAAQYTALLEALAKKETAYAELDKKTRGAREGLLQFEHHYIVEIKAGRIRNFLHPVDMAIAALNLLR
jgi:hypothetical protein